MPGPLCAQLPTGPLSPVVVRLLAERSLAQGVTPAATPAVAASGRATTTTRAASVPVSGALAKLGTLRPGDTRSFLARQLEFPRVRRAYETRAQRVARLFEEVGVSTPEVFFRVFKREQVLEVWTRNRATGTFVLLNSYPVCKLSGRLGPKRRQGDLQIPEGFYEIDLLNPRSSYHLSMRVDYPNPVDRANGGRDLGGDIYIHGGCATIGCVPVTDQWIEELYLIAIAAADAGQESVPVHIFPTRLDDAGLAWLGATYGHGFIDFPFWENLQEGYLAFENTRTIPVVGYRKGRYTFSRTAPADGSAPAEGSVPAGDTASGVVAVSGS